MFSFCSVILFLLFMLRSSHISGCKRLRQSRFQVMINKHMPIVSLEASAVAQSSGVVQAGNRNVEYKDVSISYRSPVPSYAERVLLTYNEDDAHLIKVVLRQTRFLLLKDFDAFADAKIG